MGNKDCVSTEEMTNLEKNIIGLRYEIEQLTNMLGVVVRNDAIKGNKNSMFDFTNDNDSKLSIDDLLCEYDAVIVCIAFSQLFQIGISQLRTMNAAEECRKLSFSCGSDDMVPNNMQRDVINCAIEMAQLNRSELIKFAKLRYPITGICLTDGKIIRFKHKTTKEEIVYVLVDSDVDDRYIDAAFEVLKERLDKRKKDTDTDLSNAEIKRQIDEAFKTAGIIAKDIRCYKEYLL